MSDINSVIIIGRLTKDAELRYTGAGTAVGKMSIACNRRIKKAQEWVDEVSFFDCVLWGSQAEALSKYLVKGKQISILGELVQNRWKTDDGQQRSKIEINCRTVQLLGGNSDSQSNQPKQQRQQPAQPSNNFEDDIPF